MTSDLVDGIKSFDFPVECVAPSEVCNNCTHFVSVARDWTSTTYHDLDIERTAVGLGAVNQCVNFVDHVIPLLQKYVAIIEGTKRPVLFRNNQRLWFLPSILSSNCCLSGFFFSASSAVSHLQNLQHISNAITIEVETISKFLLFLKIDRKIPSVEEFRIASNLVLDAEGAKELWKANIHPNEIPPLLDRTKKGSGVLSVAQIEDLIYLSA